MEVKEIWEFTLDEYIASERDRWLYSDDEKKIVHAMVVRDAIILFQKPVTEEIAINAGDFCGESIHQMWLDFQNQETIVLKYGQKPKDMNIFEFAGIIRQAVRAGEMVRVSPFLPFNSEQYRYFLSLFSADEFCELVKHTDKTGLTTWREYTIPFFTGLVFPSDLSENPVWNVCVDKTQTSVDGGELIVLEDRQFNYLSFTDLDMGLRFYHQQMTAKK